MAKLDEWRRFLHPSDPDHEDPPDVSGEEEYHGEASEGSEPDYDGPRNYVPPGEY